MARRRRPGEVPHLGRRWHARRTRATLGAYPELFSRKIAHGPHRLDRRHQLRSIPADIFDASWNGAKVEGRIYGFPAVEGFVRYGLCYNVDLVEEAGLDPKTPPETWDDAYHLAREDHQVRRRRQRHR